jgi:hypothetical protein
MKRYIYSDMSQDEMDSLPNPRTFTSQLEPHPGSTPYCISSALARTLEFWYQSLSTLYTPLRCPYSMHNAFLTT